MMKATRLLALFAVALAMLACSSKSSGTPAEKDAGEMKDAGRDSGKAKEDSAPVEKKDAAKDAPAPSLLSLCDMVVATQAALYSKCLSGPEAAWATALNAQGTCAALQAAVTAGTVKYEASKAEACVKAVGALTCPPESPAVAASFAACGTTLTGTVAAGGSCAMDVECAGDSFCSGLAAKDAPCTGTCKAKVAKGDACGVGDECVTGYECSGTAPNLTCVTPASLKLAALGDACGYDKTTKTTTLCAVGLACNISTLKCVTPVAEGATCTPGASECANFTYCDPTQKKCLGYPTNVGGNCGAEIDEDPIQCAAPNYCKITSMMSATYYAGTCAPPEATGAACKTDLDCQSGRCAYGDAGKGTCLGACPAGQ